METSFGNWVRRRRKALDLTQEELARQVGCSSSLIFKIETDERRPSRQIAELLARQLEIPAEQRELFLKVARQELAPMRLQAPDQLPERAPATPAISLAPYLMEQAPIEHTAPRAPALPVFPTVFVGREHEIDTIVQQMLDPACRLLTLTGPGGIGKTRLAVEVARRLESAFADGVTYLEMAGVGQPESILPVVADAFEIIFCGPAEPKQQVIQALQHKNVLLVLDNMEHLIAGCGLLGEILEQAPGVRLLLTSREPVHLQWEWIFEVQGLPLPETTMRGALESNSAAALFIQRMRQAARPATINEDETAAIVQICKLVDGLPLAIELAASWARVMSLDEIAIELARGLDILETSLQDVPARHRSIRLVFDHSWNLLTQAEQAALMKLSVFSSGFTREAASNATGTSVMMLSTLVNKSLLRYGKQAGRYDFHELIRHYALARLSEQPDLQQAAINRYAEYFASWLSDLEPALKSSQQMTTSARIRAEFGNLSETWRLAARLQRLDLLRQMEPCLYWYNEIHGNSVEGVASIEYAVSQLQEAGAPATLTSDKDKSTFALLVDQQGWFEFRTGNIKRAVAKFAESLALAQDVTEPDHETLYYIYVNWGYLSLISGDIDEAGRLTSESLVHARALGSQWHIAIAVNILGIVEYQRGNLAEAYQQLNDSLALWRSVGDLRGLVFCMLYLSAAAMALGEYDTVEAILQESNAIAQQKTDRWALSFGMDLLGQVAIRRGQFQAAAEYFRQSMALSQEIGDQWAVTLALIHMGEAQSALADREGAQRLFRQVYDNARQARWLPLISEVMVASLMAGSDLPAETQLSMALAVVSDPASSQPTRELAAGLRDRLAATLPQQQVEAAQQEAHRRTPEQWAGLVFEAGAADRTYFEKSLREWSG